MIERFSCNVNPRIERDFKRLLINFAVDGKPHFIHPGHNKAALGICGSVLIKR